MNKSKLQRVWVYSVIGSGYFPLDMLRYDTAVAANEESKRLIEAPRVEDRLARRVVQLMGECEPTIKRWESFGWNVIGPVLPAKKVVGNGTGG